MPKYLMKERQIKLYDSWDVIVIGGGPAGCTAAASAAREGAKTLIIEATGCLGGMGTSGLVPTWCPFSDKEKIIYRGLAQKILETCKQEMAHVKEKDTDWVPIDSEVLKRVYDDLVIESGAKVLFHSFVSAVDAEDGIISAIIVSNKEGLSAYRAKVYIDCTGDADIAAMAGAEFMMGDEESGELQPATHCFYLTNVDEYAYINGPVLHNSNPESPIHNIVASGKYPIISDSHFCNSLVGPRTVGFNAGHIWNVDNTNPISVSQALIHGRKMAKAYRDALAEFYSKAFGNAFLVSTATLMGIRETRRIVGDYILTKEDYLNRRSFEDEICRNCYYIDIHLSEKETKMKEKGMIDEEARRSRYGKGESHGVPYRCLTPKSLKNVLVAGRAISCDRAVQGNIRVMPVCLAMGEAAGIAAYMANNMGEVDVHKINVYHLRKKLKEYGAYIL